MSKLKKKPSALKRGHPTLPNPDPLTRLNPDPIGIRIRIRNPAPYCIAFDVLRSISEEPAETDIPLEDDDHPYNNPHLQLSSQSHTCKAL